MTSRARQAWISVGIVSACLGIEPSRVAAQAGQGRWDVTQPRGKTREIDFVTDEGTYMSVDLSPDGQWVVFDLLGHVYRVSSTGGDAESLTQNSGIALNYHPRYSPDGREIAFISDRRGQDNLWVMNSDGSNPRPRDEETHGVRPGLRPRVSTAILRRHLRLAATQPGYLGIETARGADGFGITVSYWETPEAIRDWKEHAEHLVAQEQGVNHWYEHYELRVARVERAYSGPIGRLHLTAWTST